MIKTFTFLTLFTATSLVPATFAAGETPEKSAVKTLQPIDLFELEYASDPQISPDGSTVAYVRRSGDVMKDRFRSNIWIVDLKNGDHRPLLSGPDTYVSPRWSPDGSKLAYLSNDTGSMQLRVRWMDNGQTALVTNLPSSPQGITWSPDSKQIAFTLGVPGKGAQAATLPSAPAGAEWAAPPKAIDSLVYRVDGQGFLETSYQHIFVVPADGGTARQLTSGDFNHNGPLSWTNDNAAILFSANRNEDWEYQVVESDIWKVELADGNLTQLTTRKGPDYSPVVSPNGEYIAYLGYEDRGLSSDIATLSVTPVEGGDTAELNADLDRQAENLTWASDSSGIYFSADDYGKSTLYFQPIKGKRQLIASDLGGTTLGRPYTSGSYTVSKKGDIVYTLSRPDRPADLALLKSGGDKAKILTGLNEDLLASKSLAKLEAIKWPSSFDGLEIEGWVLTPPDFDSSKSYPLILEIHGGPHAAYGPHFTAELQRFAAEGYVVLYCNPRGSTSYGQEFAQKIDKRYPSEDYDDLMSGVDFLISKGFVDEKNLFVTGGSGGGTLTAWIIGKTDRFRAAVVAKPVINWISFNLTADFSQYFTEYWFGEYPWENLETYWERSPLSLVGNVTTPTLLLTGESDFRTPISETEQYYQALKMRKVDTAMIRVPGSSHNLTGRPSQLVSKIENILHWFDTHRHVETETLETVASPNQTETDTL